jgi:xylan 1,4-beta-xylosidase
MPFQEFMVLQPLIIRCKDLCAAVAAATRRTYLWRTKGVAAMDVPLLSRDSAFTSRGMQCNLIPQLRLGGIALLLVVIAIAYGVNPTPPAYAAVRSPRLVSLDFQSVQAPLVSPGLVCIGGEHAALELNSESLRQLAIAHRECGFKFIRFHGVLAPDMKDVARAGNGKLVYHWGKIDRLYSDLLRAGVKPIVELSFMPTALASGKQTVFFYHGNITMPQSMAQWSSFITAFVGHLERRFGRAQVRSWYFEVWNEPNYSAFFTKGFHSYMALYAATARAVKSVDEQLRVGGPATSGLGWINRFIKHCYTQHVPLDFISAHTYGCGPHRWADGAKGLRVNGDPSSISGGITEVLGKIHKSPFPRLPLLITEWGPSYSSRDPMHDTYFQAVYLLENLKQVGTGPRIMSYWALSDIFDEDGPQVRPFEGGFGLFNPQGIEKPSFFALKYLHEIRGRQIADADQESWATRRGGGISFLAWDYRWPRQTSPDHIFFKQQHPSTPARPLILKIIHVPAGRYRLEMFREGYRHNDAYTRYEKMGSPARLNQWQLSRLRVATADKPVVDHPVLVNNVGTFRQVIPMRSNGVILLRLVPQR